MNNLNHVIEVFLFLLLVLFLAIKVLLIVADWKIFSKAGKPGWSRLIPIYNVYVMSDVAFGNQSYFIAIIVLWVISFIEYVLKIKILSNYIYLVSLALYIIYRIKLSKAFGKSNGFTVGLVFLPYIFFPILAFDKAQYIGPQKVLQ